MLSGGEGVGHEGAGSLEHGIFRVDAAQLERVALGELDRCPAQGVLDCDDRRVGLTLFVECVAAEALAQIVVSYAHALESGGCAEDAFSDSARDHAREEVEQVVIVLLHDHRVSAVAVSDLSEDRRCTDRDDGFEPMTRCEHNCAHLMVYGSEERERGDAHGELLGMGDAWGNASGGRYGNAPILA